jgi:hypothetical protein
VGKLRTEWTLRHRNERNQVEVRGTLSIITAGANPALPSNIRTVPAGHDR